MKKFSFKLQRILDVREKLELEQKNKLAIAAAEYQQVLLKKDGTYVKVEKARTLAFENMKQNVIDIRHLQNLDLLKSQADLLAFSLAPEIEEKKQKMEAQKIRFNKAHKDKRAIEILKEQTFKKYKVLLDKEETDAMDEIAKNFSRSSPNSYQNNTF